MNENKEQYENNRLSKKTSAAENIKQSFAKMAKNELINEQKASYSYISIGMNMVENDNKSFISETPSKMLNTKIQEY